MPRMSPTERRDAIIEAALTVALRKGFGSTTVRDVAAELGCSSGLIHHYFESMDDVLAAAFDQAAGRELASIEVAMAATDDPIAKLTAFFASYGRGDQDWAFQLWLDAWAEAGRKPALGATSRRINVGWQRLLASAIVAGVDSGTFACPDPDATAWRMLSLLDGLALQIVAHGSVVPREVSVEWSIAATEDELGIARGTLPRLNAVAAAETAAAGVAAVAAVATR
ncbi:MAG: regulatory protein TetR [Acidimicrobiaceae bacterium]|jgi:AcrR family transcriptional regulator|nr:MAG: regulatory protein TetR [Acidimicrobiaceae bacterium]